jgi:hypothetical protein
MKRQTPFLLGMAYCLSRNCIWIKSILNRLLTLKITIMKTLVKLLFFVVCVAIIAGCQKDEEMLKNDVNLKSAEYGSNNDGENLTVTIPFKANFTVWGQKPEHDCGDNKSVHMQGNGTITHLGKMKTIMTFCSDGQGNYWNTDVVFISANGDELYASIPVGVIVPNEEDNAAHYSRRFNDEMYFVGGTGRFDGASGMAMTHAYVHYPSDEWQHKGDEVWHTDFFSSGELILVKGKR